MKSTSTSYKTIFKATTLFASVKVVTVLVSLIKNKIVAILLGTSGTGVFGILTNSLNLINSIADLGLSKSAVRNISEANETGDSKNINKNISIFRKLLFYTSLSSSIISILFSKQLSVWAFGNDEYTWSFILLSIAVFFNSISVGQIAIMQGLRKVKILAKASSLGAFFGLIVSVPCFYFLKEDGIVPSIIASAAASLLFSSKFLRELKIEKQSVEAENLKKKGKNMIYLGLAMMMISFMFALSGFIIRAYISRQSGVAEVGIFQSGYTIISGYFGMIFAAMSADYFPRLSAINKDNKLVEKEVNQQAIVSLILISPLVHLILLMAPLMIELLYTNKFLPAVDYVQWAVFGIIFQAGSQTMGMVLIAKNRPTVFIFTVLIFQSIFLLNNIILYDKYGIVGLGIAFALNMTIHFIGTQFLMKFLYQVTFGKSFYKIFTVVLLLTLFSFLIVQIEEFWLRYSIGFIILGISALYSLKIFKKIMKIDSIFKLLSNKIGIK